MVAMACETRRCRVRSSRRPACHAFTRRELRCRRRPGGRLVGRDVVGRYYDPGTGQFLSVDPMLQETEQAYLYVGDDPVNGSDPSGMVSYTPEIVDVGTFSECAKSSCSQACTSNHGHVYAKGSSSLQVCFWVANPVITTWKKALAAHLTPTEAFYVALGVDCHVVWHETNMQSCANKLIGPIYVYRTLGSNIDNSVNWLVSEVATAPINAHLTCWLADLGPTLLDPVTLSADAASDISSLAKDLGKVIAKGGAACD
jgi:hypothetical protein